MDEGSVDMVCRLVPSDEKKEEGKKPQKEKIGTANKHHWNGRNKNGEE